MRISFNLLINFKTFLSSPALAFALFISTLQGCGNDFSVKYIADSSNSVNGLDDKARLARFDAASKVLNTNCASCHSATGAQSASSFNLSNLKSEADFVAAGLVSAGSLAQSKLLRRLKNNSAAGAAANMPPTGQLSDADYLAVTNWVNMLPNGPTNLYACDVSELPDGLDAKRLTKTEYLNAVHNLLSRAIGDAQADSVTRWYGVDINTEIPADASGTYSTGDQNFSATHAMGFFDVADVVSTTISKNFYTPFVTTYIGYAKGDCALTSFSTLDTNCEKALIRNFTLRAFGRPLDESTEGGELQAYLQEFSLAGSAAAGVEALIFKTLLSPAFLHHIQLDVAPSSGRIYKLSSYGIARRLAFAFTQSLADDTLLSLAASKDLSDEGSFLAALQYVSTIMDPTVTEFTKEWLHLDKLPEFTDTGAAKFAYITPGLNVNTDNGTLRAAMINEATELVSYVAKNNRPATELFTSNVSFARNPVLMNIYGQATAAPATVNEQNAIRFPAGQRSGLLTRAAMLYSGGANENLVIRGIHIRKYLLCLNIADPPANLPVGSLGPPVDDASLTTRERYAHKTSGAACIGCHSQINPAGFALSKYNAFGGFQDNEPIFEQTSGGMALTKTLPVDAQVDLTLLGIPAQSHDGVEYGQIVGQSDLYKKCMTENFYTFANGLSQRPSETRSCSMKHMYNDLESGGSLQDFFKSSVLDFRFRYRTIE